MTKLRHKCWKYWLSSRSSKIIKAILKVPEFDIRNTLGTEPCKCKVMRGQWLLCIRGLHRPTFFGPSHCHSGKIKLGYYYISGCNRGRKWGNTWNLNSLSLIMDLSKLLLEDTRCIPYLEKAYNTIPLHHHPNTLVFQFCPLILILLLGHNNL